MKPQDLRRVYINGRYTILQLMTTIGVTALIVTAVLNYLGCC